MIIDDTRLLGAARSSGWRKVRAKHVKDNPLCACCGGKKKIEVHHIKPFHLNPELELEPSNLLTLCENKKQGLNCHLCIGHLGSYQSYNDNVEIVAQVFNYKFKTRP